MKVLTDGYVHDNNGKDSEKKRKDEENHKVRDNDEGYKVMNLLVETTTILLMISYSLQLMKYKFKCLCCITFYFSLFSII